MQKNSKCGNIIVISAPSGAGKTTICNEIVKKDKDTLYSISTTTRQPRDGEKNGVEYFFETETKFKKMIKDKKFAEWAKVYGNFYGTPKSFLDKMIKSGKNVILNVDVQGGMSIKRNYPRACMIFITTSHFDVLKERLASRNKDSKKVMALRLKEAKEELKSLHKYEYVVVNDHLKTSVEAVKTIIKSLQYKQN